MVFETRVLLVLALANFARLAGQLATDTAVSASANLGLQVHNTTTGISTEELGTTKVLRLTGQHLIDWATKKKRGRVEQIGFVFAFFFSFKIFFLNSWIVLIYQKAEIDSLTFGGHRKRRLKPQRNITKKPTRHVII